MDDISGTFDALWETIRVRNDAMGYFVSVAFKRPPVVDIHVHIAGVLTESQQGMQIEKLKRTLRPRDTIWAATSRNRRSVMSTRKWFHEFQPSAGSLPRSSGLFNADVGGIGKSGATSNRNNVSEPAMLNNATRVRLTRD